MIRKICLFLLIAIIVIQPALAQNSGAPRTRTIDLGLASDDEFAEALNKASDIELINKEDSLTAEAELSNETQASSEAPVEAEQEVSVPAEETPALAEEAPVEAEREVSVPAEETPALAEEAPVEAEQEEVSVPTEETPALAEEAPAEAEQEVSVPVEETPALAEEAPAEAEQEVSVPAEETPALAEEAPAEAEREVSVPAEETPALAEEAPAEAEQEEVSVPAHDNEYLQESHRLAKLAEKSFSEGDYDASTKYADEAAWFAKKSDVYVAITTAKSYLDRAVSSGVSVQFSPEYREAENWYRQSLNASESEEWDIAIAAANMVVELLEGLDASDSVTTSVPLPALPAAYTVRPWSVSKDCFWNIAGFPWVYGNPRQWRVLYNANKSKLPNPNNPNILEPGTVLDIPSIKGELREGEWDSARSYEPLK